MAAVEWDGPMLPTPTASSYGSNKSASEGAAVRPSLETMARRGFYSTPKAHDRHKGNAKRVGRFGTKHGGRNLNDEIALLESRRKNWPTPCASASKGSSEDALTRKSGRSRANDRLDHAVYHLHAGQLNPDRVEWLMGWPIGWTDITADLTLRDDWQHSNYWATEPDIPRITARREHRAKRIEALGNGQVPLCAAVAFERLRRRLTA